MDTQICLLAPELVELGRLRLSFLVQVREYLVNDHRIFDTGNDLQRTATLTPP